MRLSIRNANQFRASTPEDRVGEAVETPQWVLLGGAIVLFRKVHLSLCDTKARRTERIDQAAAGDPIQGGKVPADTGGHEVRVSFATDGDFNQALAQGLKQLLVSGVFAVVARRTAGSQKYGHRDRERDQEL
jgi:hypothetical protein